MHLKGLASIFLVILIVSPVFAQKLEPPGNPTLKDSTVVNNLLQITREKFGVDPGIAMNLATQARDLSQRICYRKGEAAAIKYIGNAYYMQKNPAEALQKWQEALAIFREINDVVGVADLLGNIGTFYYNRGDNVKALDHYLQSLKIAEEIGYKKAMINALNNIGGIYFTKSATYDKALKYYQLALPLCKELADDNSLGAISVNVGNIYLKQNEDDSALLYFNEALRAYTESPANIPPVYNSLGTLYLKDENFSLATSNYEKALLYARKTEGKLNIVKALIGLGKVQMKLENYRKAIGYYKEAEVLAKELDALADSEDIYEDLAIAYSRISDYNNAFQYQTLFTRLKDSLYNVAFDEKVATLQFDFELEKKQGEINLLTKDKELQEAALQRQRLVKNAFLSGLILILFIAFILFRNYRQKVKINKVLDQQKGEIESLLLNILPSEVAKELQQKGHAVPRNFDRVSVLFTDFKGFTVIADQMAPEDLVRELNSTFVAFDNIIEKYGIEKIKTIGDAYMCAGGIPTPHPDHTINIIRAALEIRDFVFHYNHKRIAKGLETWDIRIGVHVGPVVAGVVGRKKYAYDIWGSTVNIASRMESSGLPGQVNISAATYELVKEHFECIYRGKIHAKNVGEIDMYLVERELTAQPEIITEKAGARNQIPRIIPG